MEIAVLQGGHVFFPDYNPHVYEGELTEAEQYSELYWELVSSVLTKLVLRIVSKMAPYDDTDWLCSLRQLQHLELLGHDPTEERHLPYLLHPTQLSLPALRVLRLEKLLNVPSWHFDCPSLEALHLREIQGLSMPSGLGSCSRLTTLDVAAPLDPTHVNVNGDLRAAIESVQGTLEVLDISGWGPALNGVLELISRLPRLHTLVAQRNGLTAVPALPATLTSLGLRANEFTEVPEQLDSLTQLTSLALSSKELAANLQIRRPLDALINLPQLRELTLVLESSSLRPAYKRWNVQSLYYLGLALHQIAKIESSLRLKF